MPFFTFSCLLRLLAANSFGISSEFYGHKKAQKAQTGNSFGQDKSSRSQADAILGRPPLQMPFFTFSCLLRLFAANSFGISPEFYGHKKAQKAQTGNPFGQDKSSHSQADAILGRPLLQMPFFTFSRLLRLLAANSFGISPEFYGHKKAQKAQTGNAFGQDKSSHSQADAILGRPPLQMPFFTFSRLLRLFAANSLLDLLRNLWPQKGSESANRKYFWTG